MKIEKISAEALGISLQALALSRAIRDVVLTDEQKTMVQELYKVHAIEIVNDLAGWIDMSDEALHKLLGKVTVESQ